MRLSLFFSLRLIEKVLFLFGLFLRLFPFSAPPSRNPFIGYNVKSYDITDKSSANGGASEPPYYNVTDQRTLLPSLRNAATGIRIRPVDVRTSPVGDGALLLTADRDDLDTRVDRGGGIYRVRAGNGSNGGSSSVEPIDLAAVNTDDENVSSSIYFCS